MVIYVPGTDETDSKKQNMSLQQLGGATSTLQTSVAANTADILTKVTGAASATDNALARFDGATGKFVQNSEVTLGDSDGKLTRTAGISLSGTNTNDSAATGYVGEIISAGPTASGTLTTATATNINSIPLTAGHWRIIAAFTAGGTGGPSVTEIFVSVNTVTATANTTPGQCFRIRGFTLSDPLFYSQAANFTVHLSGSATYYLNTTCQYTGGTFSVLGTIEAERVR